LKLLEPMTRMRINSIPFGAEFVPDYSQIFISLFLGIAFFILLTNHKGTNTIYLREKNLYQ
ncbi:TPA: hypothetical protein ACQPH7_001771, partial [Streptococcus pyogenes]